MDSSRHVAQNALQHSSRSCKAKCQLEKFGVRYPAADKDVEHLLVPVVKREDLLLFFKNLWVLIDCSEDVTGQMIH